MYNCAMSSMRCNLGSYRFSHWALVWHAPLHRFRVKLWENLALRFYTGRRVPCAWSAFWWARGTDHRVASSALTIEVPHGCCEPIHWRVQCSVWDESSAHKGFGPSVFAQVSTPAHSEGLAEGSFSSWMWVWAAVGAGSKVPFSSKLPF